MRSAGPIEADIAQALNATDEAFDSVKRRLPTLQPHPVLEMLLADH